MKEIKNHKLLYLILFLSFLVGGFKLISHSTGPQVLSAHTMEMEAPIPPEASDLEAGKVSRVIDGDTFVLETGEKIRLIGMDTPETVDPRKSVQCFGKEASEFTKSILKPGTEVKLEKDVTEVDKYGRSLRYVYVNNVFLDQLLVEEGYARILTIPPNVKYSELLLKTQQDAEENNHGLWSKCSS